MIKEVSMDEIEGQDPFTWVWYGDNSKRYDFKVEYDSVPDISGYVMYHNSIYVPFASNSLLGTLDIRRIDTGETHTGVKEQDLLVIVDLEETEVE